MRSRSRRAYLASCAPHKKKHIEIGDPKIERGILTGDRDRLGLATAPALVGNAALHKKKYLELVTRIERGILTNR